MHICLEQKLSPFFLKAGKTNLSILSGGCGSLCWPILSSAKDYRIRKSYSQLILQKSTPQLCWFRFTFDLRSYLYAGSHPCKQTINLGANINQNKLVLNMIFVFPISNLQNEWHKIPLAAAKVRVLIVLSCSSWGFYPSYCFPFGGIMCLFISREIVQMGIISQVLSDLF